MSVYIHIPFCDSICSYCDFTKMYYNEDTVLSYLSALEKEIKTKYQNELVSTIYIGGGTPSSLSIEALKKLMKILDIFNKGKNCEITFECNLDVTLEKLEIIKKTVNRLSIGVQTFNQELLKYLNRSYIDPFSKLEEIKSMGFNNINIDLIYAIPKETLEDVKKDLENFLKLGVNHISTYSLIIEDNTVLGINKTKSIDEDLDYEMYKLICKTLTDNDFSHYEISNFAKEGYSSKHNLTYWNNDCYYGFGLGASGYLDGVRYTNTKSINHYFSGKYIYEKEELTNWDKMSYEMILGLRKLEGVSLIKFKEKYQKDLQDVFDINELINEKKLIIKDDYIFINPKYLYVSNEILLSFIKE